MTRRKQPAPPQDRPLPNHTDDPQHNRLALALAVLTGAGLTVAGRCVDCGAAIVSPTSLARMRGPKCAAKSRAGAVVH